MRNIKLTDGTVYQVDRCGAADGRLYVRIINTSMQLRDIIPVFGDPDRVDIIEHYFDGTNVDHVVFHGFTMLRAASLERAGVQLTLEEAEPGAGWEERMEKEAGSRDQAVGSSSIC